MARATGWELASLAIVAAALLACWSEEPESLCRGLEEKIDHQQCVAKLERIRTDLDEGEYKGYAHCLSVNQRFEKCPICQDPSGKYSVCSETK